MTRKLWFVVSGFFAGIGLCLAGLVTQAQAQWGSEQYRSLSRGQIAHSLLNPGMSGKKDDAAKLAESSFSYPMGRNIKVYSGGSEREGWNAKSQSGGEGFWIMSDTGGNPHGSYAGSTVESSDIVGVPHDPSTYPEAYLGVVQDQDYALAIRTKGGGQASWTNGATIAGLTTNWWPASNTVESGNTNITNQPVIIWNYRYGRYNSGESFTDRIASGELPQYTAPKWAEALSEDDFPENIGIQKGKSTATGLQWTRKWYEFATRGYDNSIIVDNTVENTGSTTQEGVYIVFQNRFISGQNMAYRGGNPWNYAYPWNRDDWCRFTGASNYMDGVSRADFVAGNGKPAGLQRGVDLFNQGHALVYLHDGQSVDPTMLYPNVGDPYKYSLALERYTREQTWVREGMIQHGEFFGLGTVDAIPPFNRYGGEDPDTYVAPHDNPATAIDESQQQPATVLIDAYRNKSDFDMVSPDKDSDALIYDKIANGGYDAEPGQIDCYTQLVAYGPYTLAPGEKAKVVVAYVVGLASDAAKYSDYKKYAPPFNMGWMNLYGGTGQSPVKFSDRQGDIPLSEDVMFDNFDKAIQAYNWGYDIPNEPQSVKIAWDSNLQGKTQIRWTSFGEDSKDPDYTGAEAQDLRGYRIYRSKMQYQGDWEYVGEFSFDDVKAGTLPAGVKYDPTRVFTTVKNNTWPTGIPLKANKYVAANDPTAGADVPGTYTFDDPSTNAGFPDWYSVRLYDSGHADWKGTGEAIPVLESSESSSGGALIGSSGGVVPVVPGAAVFDKLEEQVRVVPNPYKQDDDLHSYQRQENMRFINLPGRCQIDIYDVTGQRVWTFYNDDPLKGEVTYLQFAENRPSDFGEAMFPGIYFWKVTSLMPGNEGKTQTGTFAIIK
jgi:hypothetical protein